MLPDVDVETPEADAETEVETHADAGGKKNGASGKSVEDIAREKGWRPKDEYMKLPHADPDKFVDAADFLRKGEENWPLVKAALRKTERELAESKKLMQDLVKSQKASQEAAVARAIAALKADKKSAVAEGDVARVEKIDEQIDTLKASTSEDGKATQQHEPMAAIDPEYIEWGKQNPWFFKDPVLNTAARSELDMIEVDPETQDLPTTEKLKLVTRAVRNRYPTRFPAPRGRPPANSVEGGSGQIRNGGGKKGWADLPVEHQQLADRLIRAKAVKSREDYLKDYAW